MSSPRTSNGIWQASLVKDSSSASPGADQRAASETASSRDPHDMNRAAQAQRESAAPSRAALESFALPHDPAQSPDTASEPGNAARPMGGPVDPGARIVVREMSHAVVHGGLGIPRPMIISLDELRNLSHATPREFQEMRTRLADMLSRAGSIDSMAFASHAADPAMLLHGTAYLVTSDGLDQWELYLSLRPAGKDWFAWQGRGPIRLLRQPRPNTQQIFYPIPLK